MKVELAMHHQEAPGVDCPMNEIGVAEHIGEMSICRGG